MQSITIRKPDDWHVHFRDHIFLNTTVKATAEHFARALVMPNLKPALTNASSLMAYRQRILDALPKDTQFSPYMTFYLNKNTPLEDLIQAKTNPYILGAKFYPANATTHSQEGCKDIKQLYPLLEVMTENNLVLQIHGETTEGDIFEREEQFINTVLKQLALDFPALRIVLEHISTQAAVEFVTNSSDNIAATITPQHLLFNRNKIFEGGIKPHYYCLPILKQASDQKALLQAAMSGNPKFFAGTDSAPHSVNQKETACGCAGIFSAPYAVSAYAEVFTQGQCLEKLNNFMSVYGAAFYNLPLNSSEITLVKKPYFIPENYPFGDEKVVPIAAGEQLQWSVIESISE